MERKKRVLGAALLAAALGACGAEGEMQEPDGTSPAAPAFDPALDADRDGVLDPEEGTGDLDGDGVLDRDEPYRVVP